MLPHWLSPRGWVTTDLCQSWHFCPLLSVIGLNWTCGLEVANKVKEVAGGSSSLMRGWQEKQAFLPLTSFSVLRKSSGWTWCLKLCHIILRPWKEDQENFSIPDSTPRHSKVSIFSLLVMGNKCYFCLKPWEPDSLSLEVDSNLIKTDQ